MNGKLMLTTYNDPFMMNDSKREGEREIERKLVNQLPSFSKGWIHFQRQTYTGLSNLT